MVLQSFFKINEEYPKEVLDALAEEKRIANGRTESMESLKYLKSTDWYVTRFAETNKAIPIEVASLRAEARLKII
jgi:hypothetical protein